MIKRIINTAIIKVFKKEISQDDLYLLFVINRYDEVKPCVEFIMVNKEHHRGGYSYFETEDLKDDYFNRFCEECALEIMSESIEELLKMKAEKTGFSEG